MLNKLKKLFSKLSCKSKCSNCMIVKQDNHIELRIDTNDDLAHHLNNHIEEFNIGKNNTLKISFN